MIRFALSPDGVVTPDLGNDLPGRGAWAIATRDAVLKAASKKLFARAFKADARLPDELDAERFADRLGVMVENRALAAIGLARKAGEAVVGFDQVKAGLKSNEIAVLISATDAAEDGAEKLRRLARERPAVRAFTVDALSGALGRDGVRHAGLNSGPFAIRFLREVKRLSGMSNATKINLGAAPADVEADFSWA